jgi:hypothetical protein
LALVAGEELFAAGEAFAKLVQLEIMF